MLENVEGIQDLEDVYDDDSEGVDSDGMPLNRLARVHARAHATSRALSSIKASTSTTAAAPPASSPAPAPATAAPAASSNMSLAVSLGGIPSSAHVSSCNETLVCVPPTPRGCRHYSRGCLLVAPCCGRRCRYTYTHTSYTHTSSIVSALFLF
jgi:hypothetical protein